MYVLSIVFLFSHVVVESWHSTEFDCERAARRALAFVDGPQAIERATCRPAVATATATATP